MLLIQQSCKKSETIIQPQNEIDPAIKFFNLQGNVHPSVKKVADKINQQNQEKHFLNQFVNAQGYALWDKAVVKNVQSNTQSTRKGNTASKQSGNEDLILIPLVLKDSSQVHGALSCIVDGDSIYIKLIDGSKYKWYTANPDNMGMSGEGVSLLLMQLDKSVFNHKVFKITDSTAFGKLVSKYSTHIKILDSKPKSFKPATAARWVLEHTEYTYTTDEPDICGCNPGYPCPEGGTHEVSHTISLSGYIWVDDEPWYDPNVWGNGNGGGSGDYSGGGNGGGNNNGLPVEPDLGADPAVDANGFLYSRIAELQHILFLNPYALAPCDSLNIMPLETYGPMYQRVAQFIPSINVVNRLDSIRAAQGGWIVDNFNFQSLTDAYGTFVNCDYFPIRITQLPINNLTGLQMSSAEFLEYFRLNIN